MTAFAELGHPVVFVDNLGTRMPRGRDLRRVRRRLTNWVTTSRNTERRNTSKPKVDSPIVLPLQHIRAVRKFGSALLARRLRKRLVGAEPLVVWTYLPMPVIGDVASALGADLLVYDWADDASAHVLTRSRRHRERIAAWEEAMLARADLVFVASNELLRRRGSPNRKTFVMPHGAETAGKTKSRPPGLIAHLPHPRIGFVGSISEWVDLELVVGIAEARPGWSLVMVGPIKSKAARIRRKQNVVLTGEVPPEQIPLLLDGFDAAIIPYKLRPAIEVASPVKLREYLAHGLPVVSVDIPEVRKFAPPVRLAQGSDGFVEALEQALREGKASRPHRSIRSWRNSAEEMTVLIEKLLKPT